MTSPLGRHRRHRTVAACALVAATAVAMTGLTACDPDQPTPPPTTPVASGPATTATSPSPTPTPSPRATSPVEREKAEIRKAVLTYNSTLNRIRINTDADINDLRKVAADELLELNLGIMKEWRAKGWRQVNPAKIENLTIQKFNNDEGQATVSFCGISTDVDVLDRNGNSQVTKGRPDTFPTVMTVRRLENAWLPVRERTEGQACDDQ